ALSTARSHPCPTALSPPSSRRSGLVLLHPEDGTLHAQPSAIADANLLTSDVVYSEFLGDHWRHVVAVAHDLSLRVLTPDQAPAIRVWLSW
ncbi:MAG TPA: TOBE domain-containing protein, partial [Chloroflexota bacterium]|nr:TOBE domain-containing protein [Chloroflexota bacterium]